MSLLAGESGKTAERRAALLETTVTIDRTYSHHCVRQTPDSQVVDAALVGERHRSNEHPFASSPGRHSVSFERDTCLLERFLIADRT